MPSARRGKQNTPMNKAQIIKELLARLKEDMSRQRDANKRASAGATDSEARAETKWDTCSLESSYLARGHAQQFNKLSSDVHQLQVLTLPDFTNCPIGTGALVEVDLGYGPKSFLLLQCGGGTSLNMEEHKVMVITPDTPMGKALYGKSKGDEFSFRAVSVQVWTEPNRRGSKKRQLVLLANSVSRARIKRRSWMRSSVVIDLELFTSAAIILYGESSGCTPRM